MAPPKPIELTLARRGVSPGSHAWPPRLGRNRRSGAPKAIPTTWEIDTQTYGGDVYNVINIPVRVDVREAVTLTP